MGKVPKSRARLRAKFEKIDRERPPKGRLRPPPTETPVDLDTIELMTAVCEIFCEGWPVSELIGHIEDRYGKQNRLTREKVYDHLHRAADEGWLDYRPPSHLVYGQFLRERYDWLEEVQVVHTATVRDVAKRAAAVLLGLLQEFKDVPDGKVHVGLAGGISVRHVASSLAAMLCEPIPFENLPKEIVLHSLVAGFDLRDPTTHPDTFFSFFVDEPSLRVDASFVGLMAPAVVRTTDIPTLRRTPEIEEAFAAARDVHIILTSGSEWADPHSLLRRCLERRRGNVGKLQRAGCVGDLLWLPFGPAGPIEKTGTDLRAFTLFELSDFPRLIRDGRKVVMMLGPCAGCRRPKGSMLAAVLEQPERYVTHLVTDSRTAGELYVRFHDGDPESPGGRR